MRVGIGSYRTHDGVQLLRSSGEITLSKLIKKLRGLEFDSANHIKRGCVPFHENEKEEFCELLLCFHSPRRKQKIPGKRTGTHATRKRARRKQKIRELRYKLDTHLTSGRVRLRCRIREIYRITHRPQAIISSFFQLTTTNTSSIVDRYCFFKVVFLVFCRLQLSSLFWRQFSMDWINVGAPGGDPSRYRCSRTPLGEVYLKLHECGYYGKNMHN